MFESPAFAKAEKQTAQWLLVLSPRFAPPRRALCLPAGASRRSRRPALPVPRDPRLAARRGQRRHCRKPGGAGGVRRRMVPALPRAFSKQFMHKRCLSNNNPLAISFRLNLCRSRRKRILNRCAAIWRPPDTVRLRCDAETFRYFTLYFRSFLFGYRPDVDSIGRDHTALTSQVRRSIGTGMRQTVRIHNVSRWAITTLRTVQSYEILPRSPPCPVFRESRQKAASP